MLLIEQAAAPSLDGDFFQSVAQISSNENHLSRQEILNVPIYMPWDMHSLFLMKVISSAKPEDANHVPLGTGL